MPLDPTRLTEVLAKWHLNSTGKLSNGPGWLTQHSTMTLAKG